MRAKRRMVFKIEPNLVRFPMTATGKEAAIRELLDVLSGAGSISDREAAEKVVFEREASMSTGMEHGIAIPHGKTDTVDSLLVAVGIHPEGIDFDSVDGRLSQIFIMTLSPASKSGPHIRFLAQVSRLLRQSKVRERLLNAKSAEEVATVLNR